MIVGLVGKLLSILSALNLLDTCVDFCCDIFAFKVMQKMFWLFMLTIQISNRLFI